MRPPTRISPQDHPYPDGDRPPNPYHELAALADPEDDVLGLGLRAADEEDADDWAPPNHRRTRRGRRRVATAPLAVKAVVALLVGAAFLTVADRWAVLSAEDTVEEKLKHTLRLEAEPEVSIHGFPFLTQAFDKRLDQVDVTIPDVAADRVSLAKVEATARDIRLTGTSPTSISGAVVSRMQGRVLLSFDDLDRELGASQVRFTKSGHDSVLATGTLPVAGHEVRMRAQARIQRVGGRGIETDVTCMRVEVGDIATYEPGPHAGLRLTRKAADRLRRDAARVKSLLSVPSLAKRFGVPSWAIGKTLASERRLHQITGSPRFMAELMRMNLVDVVAEHPWLLEKIGISPAMVSGLMKMAQPQLPDRLSLSFELPEVPGYVRLQNVTVQRDGIRADLSGMDLPFGKAATSGHGKGRTAA